jgi:hypothetical protein
MIDELDMSTLTLKIAEAILLHNGRISIEDIRALPFLDNDQEIELIADYLKTKFGTRTYIIDGQNGGLSDLEELIVLNSVI